MTDTLTTSLAALPHGPEFRFIDRVTALEPGRRGRAEYRVRGDETFLRGHFPGQPLFPGVLLVEAAAQLAGIVAQSDPDLPPIADLRLTAVRNAKILGTGGPGDVLAIEAEINARLGNLINASAAITVNGRLVLRTEVTLSGSGT